MNETQELKNRVKVLEDFINSLKASHSIPLAVDQAFRKRFFASTDSEESFVDGGDGGSVDVSVYNSFDVSVPNVTGKRTVIIDGVSYDFLYQ